MERCCVKFRTGAGICVAAAILALFAAVFAGCGRKTEAEPPFYPEFRSVKSVVNGLEVTMDFEKNNNYFGGMGVYPSECWLDVAVTVTELDPTGETDFGGVPMFSGKEKTVLKSKATADYPTYDTDFVMVIEGFGGTGSDNATGGNDSSNATIPGTNDGKTYKLTFKTTNDANKAVDERYLLYRDGTVLLSEAGAELLVGEMTNDEKISLVVGNYGDQPVPGNAGSTTPFPYYLIPSLSLADGPQGVRCGEQTVWYPSCQLMASTWDEEMIERVGAAIGSDCVATGVDVILGPGMNIQRLAVGGRNFEYFSEDPLLTGKAGAAYSRGVASQGAAVSLKHYAVNNQETARGSVSAAINDRALFEIYLRGYNYAIREGNVLTVMSSYNKVNGTYTSTHYDLLKWVLRKHYGFKGFVMSDWGSGGSVTDKVRAGNDLATPGTAEQVEELKTKLEKDPEYIKYIDEACANILKVVANSKAYNELFSGKHRAENEIEYEKNRATALAAAESGMVLLKNEDGALPIAKGSRIALMGMRAYNPIYGGGGSGVVFAAKTESIDGALYDEGFILDPTLAMWYGVSDKPRKDFEEYIKTAAESCEAAVIVIGRETSEGEDMKTGEGGFLLTENEKICITKSSEAFRAAGKKTIVILMTGNPVETDSWKDCADAILWCGMAGETLGKALVRVLDGTVNPSGKLTMTWPSTLESTPYYYDYPGSAYLTKYRDDIYVGYRYYETFGVDESFCFGHGLGYTSFEYSDFEVKIASGERPREAMYDLSVTVKNTGKVSGREVCEFYITKPGEEGELLPARELCGFVKTKLLKPGQSQRITVTVTWWEFAEYVNENKSLEIVKGEYAFSVGASSRDIKFTQSVTGRLSFPISEDLSTESEDAVEPISPGHLNEYEEERENLALGAETRCSGVEGGYASKYAVDGDLNTRWSAAGTWGDRFLVIDLGDKKTVDKLDIAWESNTAYGYWIRFSVDGENWTEPELYQMKYEIVDRDILHFEPFETRFIEITVNDGANWCSIYEVGVYGG